MFRASQMIKKEKTNNILHWVDLLVEHYRTLPQLAHEHTEHSPN